MPNPITYRELYDPYRAPQVIPGTSGDMPSNMFKTARQSQYHERMREADQQNDSGLRAIEDLLRRAQALEAAPQESYAAPQRTSVIDDILAGIQNYGERGADILDNQRFRRSQLPGNEVLLPEEQEMALSLGSSAGSVGLGKGIAGDLISRIMPYLQQGAGKVTGALGQLTAKLPEEVVPYSTGGMTLKDIWAATGKTGRPRQGYAQGMADDFASQYGSTTEQARSLADTMLRDKGVAHEIMLTPPNALKLGVRPHTVGESAYMAMPEGASNAVYRINDVLKGALDSAGSPELSALLQRIGAGVQQAGTAAANAVPTLGRGLSEEFQGPLNRAGRTVTDALSGAVSKAKEYGLMGEAQPGWYDSVVGPARKRYLASGAKNAPEGADLWQRDLLKTWQRDLKPPLTRQYNEFMDVAKGVDWPFLAATLGPGLAARYILDKIPSPDRPWGSEPGDGKGWTTQAGTAKDFTSSLSALLGSYGRGAGLEDNYQNVMSNLDETQPTKASRAQYERELPEAPSPGVARRRPRPAPKKKFNPYLESTWDQPQLDVMPRLKRPNRAPKEITDY